MQSMQQRLDEARRYIPGGVNSPVRAFTRVGGTPVFMQSGQGPHLYDADGNRYIDYVCSWGAMITGHADPHLVEQIRIQAGQGLGYGTPTELETRLAARVCALVPAAEQLRMVSSGTEAAMTAIRLARACTRRDTIVKFSGGYHGHSDSLLVKAGSGVATLGIPDSPGVPEALAALTLTLPYNDAEAVRQLYAAQGEQIAAVLVEPVAGNMGCIPPRPGFLECLREQCSRYGSLLVFDEVMSGFRVAPGGAGERYGITPDLVLLGKVLGGGLPIGAVAGSAKLLEQLAPTGPVYQAGTLSGNPMAMTAGLAVLEQLTAPGFHARLEHYAQQLCQELARLAATAGIPFRYHIVGGMFGLFFTDQPVTDYASACTTDTATFSRFFHTTLQHGVYFAPSPFESCFVSSAHNDQTLEQTLTAASKALRP